MLGIPPTQVPISPTTFISHIVPPLVGYVVAAVLVITPQTRAIRIALWPIIALLAFRAAVSVDMAVGKPEKKFFSMQLVRIMSTITMHSLCWATAKKPLVRLVRPVGSSPSTIMDALDLVTTCRAYGWDWSRDMPFPRQTRPTTSQVSYVFHTLRSIIVQFFTRLVLFQAVQSFIAGTTSSFNGQSIFDETLPTSVQYFRASIITILAAFTTYNSLQNAYDIFSIIGVVIFRQDPIQWPPPFEKPWEATSLYDFWGRRWHQWFRHMFTLCAYPFTVVLGRPGAVIGGFIASGVLHYVFVLAYNTESEMWRMFTPFAVMGPLLFVERAFYKATGNKVDGVAGWVWTMVWLLIWGNVMTEGFVRGGMYPPLGDPKVPMVNDFVVKFDAWLHTI